ncbi:hypothetical protein B1C81_05170 [Streptomyces sp. HG99]|nr:hypothetical protein B1C81_05170 [Streptomyces sp. HG99]
MRGYSVVLVMGTTLCLAFLATVTLPADVRLFARVVTRLGPGHSAAQRLDAAAVVIALGGIHLLWARTWWRNRRARKVREIAEVRRSARARPRPRPPAVHPLLPYQQSALRTPPPSGAAMGRALALACPRRFTWPHLPQENAHSHLQKG